jgi:hypothetical protein
MTEDKALEAAYLAGFNASGEGYNGEYPFEHKGKNCTDDPIWCKDRDNELAAIKQALAAQQEHEPENEPYVSLASVQEPVAWMDVDEKGVWSGLRYWSEPDNRHEVALYTTPPAAQRQWVGLTEQEAAECWSTSTVRTWQAIEAKLKEKNT